jgi:hypothetical protein
MELSWLQEQTPATANGHFTLYIFCIWNHLDTRRNNQRESE